MPRIRAGERRRGRALRCETGGALRAGAVLQEAVVRTFVALQLPEGFAFDVAALARRLNASVEGRFLPKET